MTRRKWKCHYGNKQISVILQPAGECRGFAVKVQQKRKYNTRTEEKPNTQKKPESDIPDFNATDCTLFKSNTIKHNELSITGILVKQLCRRSMSSLKQTRPDSPTPADWTEVTFGSFVSGNNQEAKCFQRPIVKIILRRSVCWRTKQYNVDKICSKKRVHDLYSESKDKPAGRWRSKLNSCPSDCVII